MTLEHILTGFALLAAAVAVAAIVVMLRIGGGRQ